MGHWSQYRHRGRGAQVNAYVNPPAAACWTVDGDDSPNLHFTSFGGGSCIPSAQVPTIQCCWYRISDPGTLFLTLPFDIGDEFITDAVDTGVAWGTRARYISLDGDPVSGWSSEKTITL